jgi:hypothetical protein
MLRYGIDHSQFRKHNLIALPWIWNEKNPILLRVRQSLLKSNASDPPGSRQVYDSFTTSSRHVHNKNCSRWISFNFVCDLFTTDFYSRLVRDNLSRTSREVGSVAGDLANLCPECHHVIFTPSSRDCTSQDLLMTSKQSRLCWRRIFFSGSAVAKESYTCREPGGSHIRLKYALLRQNYFFN